MSDVHPLTVRVSELTFRILQAKEEADGIPAATRLAQWAEEWADKERHVSNLIQRAIEREQAVLSIGKRGTA